MSISQSSRPVHKSTYRWIPWVFVAAMGVVIAVNGALVYFALGSRSAVVGNSPFEEGRRFAQILARQNAQNEQNWQVAAGYFGDLHQGRIEIELRDAAGKPIDNAQVLVRVIRPVGHLPGEALTLQGQGNGRYANSYTMAAAGQWDLLIEITGAGAGFSSQKRIVVK
jgi:nitrogen fixation protein FixH